MPRSDVPLRVKARERTELTRAAAYVRMSTELQVYSPKNQIAAISAYARQRGIEIVRVYSDEARSGLRFENRPGLKQLLADVQNGAAGYDVILVYDVSRWGRFQDADESAYYEFICRRHGKGVEYCAEPFVNDCSALSTIVKNIKRTMAAEYSRELSVKTFAGQCRTVSNGYLPGGISGYGLRRMLVGTDGSRRGVLQRGEHKAIRKFRVILVPGPEQEVETVRRIFRLYVEEELSCKDIASLLNSEGIRNVIGREWQREVVGRLLRNEKYIGNLIYNRLASRLGVVRKRNGPSEWLRKDRAFEPIVPIELFAAAQRRIKRRTVHRYGEQQLLERLGKSFGRRGFVAQREFGRKFGMPSAGSYRVHFGSLREAYRRIGLDPVDTLNTKYFDERPHLRELKRTIEAGIVKRLTRREAAVVADASSGLLRINNEIAIAVVIARCSTAVAYRSPRWGLSKYWPKGADLVVLARLEPGNARVRDYFLLPRWAFGVARGWLLESNGAAIDAFLVRNLDVLYDTVARARLASVLL